MNKAIKFLIIEDSDDDSVLIREAIQRRYSVKKEDVNYRSSKDNSMIIYKFLSNKVEVEIFSLSTPTLDRIERVIKDNLDELCIILCDMLWGKKDEEIFYKDSRSVFNTNEEIPIDELLSDSGLNDDLYPGGFRFLNKWVNDWSLLFQKSPQLISKSRYYNNNIKTVIRKLGISWIIDDSAMKDINVLDYIIDNAVELFKNTEIEIIKKETEKAQDSDSVVSKNILSELKQNINSDAPILLIGEIGTGKKYFAELAHKLSLRSQNKFEEVIFGSMHMSELSLIFKGDRNKNQNYISETIFEKCNGGTIYFADIDNWSKELQEYIYHLIETKKVRPLLPNEVDLDIKYVAGASSIELCRNNLNPILLNKLSEKIITLPNLNERRKDIPAFMSIFNYKKLVFEDDVIELFNHFKWTENINELRLKINHICSKRDYDSLITKEDISEIVPDLLRVKINKKESIQVENVDIQPQDTTVGNKYLVAAALQEELNEFYNLSSKFKHKKQLIANVYQVSFVKKGKTVNILTYSPNKMGMPFNAGDLMRIISIHQPRYTIFIGTCAGLKDKNREIGDILIPHRTFSYESGKYENGIFKPDYFSYETGIELRKQSEVLKSKVSRTLKYQVITDEDFCSGGAVIDDLKVRNEIIKRSGRKASGLDMEANSIGCLNSILTPFKELIVIKGIMDFATDKESTEDLGGKEKAKQNSADFAYRLIRHLEDENI